MRLHETLVASSTLINSNMFIFWLYSFIDLALLLRRYRSIKRQAARALHYYLFM